MSLEHSRDDVTVLTVGGVVDFLTAPGLQKAVNHLIGDGLRALIIDLSKVTFIDSAGLTILASTKERLGDTGGFAVVANNPATRRPIQLTRLDQLFAMCTTLDEAAMDAGAGRLG